MRRNVAVILAGGSGVRFDRSRPKQLQKLAGKSILEHTLGAFQTHRRIHEIAVVSHASLVGEVEEIVSQGGYDKVKKVLQGGEKRHESSLAAIRAYEVEHRADPSAVNLVIHDAVRPFVTHEIIDAVIDKLALCNAVDVAIPASDTIVEVAGEVVRTIPDRAMLMRGQTPQGFRLDVIARAYERALRDDRFRTTDDCGVVLTYLPDEKVCVVRGAEENIKITYEVDLFLADKLFQIRRQEVAEQGDLGGLGGKVLVVFGGSYGIGREIVTLCERHASLVHSFSRSTNGVDIKDAAAVRRSLAEVHAKTGRIDFVVCTAAVFSKEPIAHVSYDAIEETLRVNFLGMVTVAKEAFPYLRDSRGHLLLFTSSSYTRGRASYSLYSSTKAAAVNFAQAIAEEWQPLGVRVNCINPERTRTPMRVRAFGAEPPESLLSPERVALAAARTLLSPFTGQVIYVRR